MDLMNFVRHKFLLYFPGLVREVRTEYFEKITFFFTQIPRFRPFNWLIEISSLAARKFKLSMQEQVWVQKPEVESRTQRSADNPTLT